MTLTRIRMIQARLTDAVRRHGLITVIKVIVSALFRYGLVATVRLGGAERPFPWQRTKGVQAQAMAGRTGAPADLDERFTVEPATWSRWLVASGEDALTDRDTDSAPIVAVIRGGPCEAFDRTRAAVQAMGSRVWAPGDEAPQNGFWLFLEAGDLPAADLPQAVARVARGGRTDAVSVDLWRETGGRVHPLFLPGANPTLLKAADYLFSRLLLAPALTPADPSGADPRALLMHWLDGRSASQARGRWRHIARPLIQAALDDEVLSAQRTAAMERARSRPAAYTGEPICAVICTKDKGHLTRQLVLGLLREDPALVGEVVIVSNNTANPYALATLDELAAEPRVQVLKRDEPFNFSRLCNAGARAARTRGPLLFLNDDIAPVSGDWLARLAARLADTDIGTVGPLLLYPDERVQHAGIYLGKGGGAGHILRNARLPDEDYLLTGSAPREVSALTGAALLTPRALFDALCGFDEQMATHLQDVDYCLRARAVGRVNVFEPAAVLIHMESASIRQIDADQHFQRLRMAEKTRFLERWGELAGSDPLHPRGFDVEDEGLRRLGRPGPQEQLSSVALRSGRLLCR